MTTTTAHVRSRPAPPGDAGPVSRIGPLGVVLRTGIVALVVLALVLVETSSRSGVLWRLTTFTYEANLFAAGYALYTLTTRRPGRRGGVRGAAVLYLLVASVVWNLFLTDMSMGYTPANILLHVVVPALALLDWLLVGDDQARVRWWAPFAWLLYPTAYLGLALVVLASVGRGIPYYFLNADLIGVPTLVRNVVALAVGFVVLGYLLLLLGRASVAVRRRVLRRA